jgi:hypothetical protein
LKIFDIIKLPQKFLFFPLRVSPLLPGGVKPKQY